MNEWEFTADVAGWINEMLASDPALPFSRAKCEQTRRGSLKRRDLTLLDRNKRVCLTGEIKLPYQQDGGSPFVSAVVDDARRKAQQAQAPYFFTWNVNQCVLWETTPAKTALTERNYQSWNVVRISRPSQLENPMTASAVQYWLIQFLHDFARILRGTSPIGTKSPDEKFVEALESSLSMPISLTIEELAARYAKPHGRAELDAWMLKEQGWVIHHDAEGIRDNLERAAKFACYALVNKLVFYEALLKRYKSELPKLVVPEHIDTGDTLRGHIETHFGKAKDTTGDYETVFGEDPMSVGYRIPFYSDGAAVHWRALINQIHEFDFSKLDYEVIGGIFERLIAPEERRKYGQFYTRVEVVDLINSFCIRDGFEKVMDPACGGGTFLVRAYARKKELDAARPHVHRLADLYGVDISHFATHLTTINLATRDLVDAENYPQIVRSDFFDVAPHSTFVVLPKRPARGPASKLQHRDVAIPPLDAVVGNPPYIRQEEIPKSQGKPPKPGTKEHYLQLVREQNGACLSGRSDIHCYFWPHAAAFLKDGGYLCLLTSSQWLDVEYGFRLQEWILRNFEVVAVFESVDEPWFVGARVTTTATILRKQRDEQARMRSTVRFVQLRRPIAELLAHDGTTGGAMAAANRFRDEILALDASTVDRRYRARLVPQCELWQQGVQLERIMRTVSEKHVEADGEPGAESDYGGGKWGVYLRAPDLWFRFVDKCGGRLVPLGRLAKVRRGITSGRDDFFYPKDASDDCLTTYPDDLGFEEAYGVPRRYVSNKTIRLVRCGDGLGEIQAIEAKFLEPEIHSLMEVNHFVIEPEHCGRLVLQIASSKSKLRGTRAVNYIRWGEARGFHSGSTCTARAREGRGWYDLTGHDRAPVLWPKERQYRHVAPTNPHRLLANCRFYEMFPHGECTDADIWGGILNSSWALLASLQYGRPVGNEGNWSTMVVDVNMMLVPNIESGTQVQRDIIGAAFRRMKKRQPLQFLSERRMREMAYMQSGRERDLRALPDTCELDMPDRRELDDAVLELLGVKSKRTRAAMIDELYAYLREFFEWTRQKEERAIENKKRANRKGPASAGVIAAEVYEAIVEREGGLLRRYDRDFLDEKLPYDSYEVPQEGRAEAYGDMLAPHAVRFVAGKRNLGLVEVRVPGQEGLLALVANTARRHFLQVPHDRAECERVHAAYQDFLAHRDRRLRELIEERTADEDLQAKVWDALLILVAQGFPRVGVRRKQVLSWEADRDA